MAEWVLALLTRIQVLVAPLRARVAAPRGLGMLEYALMALVVLVIFGAAMIFFPDFFDRLTGQIEDDFDSNSR